MKNIFMKIPFTRNYIECMHNSLGNNGDGMHVSRRGILFSHYATTLNNNLTGGIFSTTLLLLLLQNATSSEYIRFIAMNTAVLSFAGMMQILSPLLFERMKKRRKGIYILNGIYHVINIIILPLLVILDLPTAFKAYMYVAASGIMQASITLSTPAYNVWIMHNLPESCRSDYLVFQSATYNVLHHILVLILAVFMDFFEAHDSALAGILIMRGVAIAAVAIQYISRNKMQEPEYNSDIKRITLRGMLTAPFSSKPFLVTILISMLWQFGTTFAGTYYNAYLLDGAKLSYTYISICGMLGLPLSLIVLPKWNKVIIRSGWLPALAVSMILYGFCYSFNAMVTGKSWWMYLVSTVYCMMIAGGTDLGNVNLAFIFMPENFKNSCLAFFSLCSSLSAMAAAVAAEKFCILTDGFTINLFGLTLENRAYAGFVSCAILVLNGSIVWMLHCYDRKKRKAANL